MYGKICRMIRENGIRKSDDEKIRGAMIILHLTYNHLLDGRLWRYSKKKEIKSD